MTRELVFGNLFLCIGAAHAGTSWLRQALVGHPHLSVCPIADVDYFHHRHVDPDHLTAERRRARLGRAAAVDAAMDGPNNEGPASDWVAAYLSDPVDDAWYRRLFPQHPDPGYACDFSNSGALLTAAHWRQIEAQCRTLRVLYLMRDPLTRLWQHGQADGHAEAAPPQDAGAPYAAFHRSGTIRRAGDYARTLAAMQDGLKIGSWRVIFYEDLAEDPQATLDAVERFLGLPATPGRPLPPVPDGVRHTPDPQHVPPDVARDLASVRREVEAAGFSPPDCWQF